MLLLTIFLKAKQRAKTERKLQGCVKHSTGCFAMRRRKAEGLEVNNNRWVTWDK